MAGTSVNALVSQWNTTANLNLTSDQEQQVSDSGSFRIMNMMGFF